MAPVCVTLAGEVKQACLLPGSARLTAVTTVCALWGSPCGNKSSSSAGFTQGHSKTVNAEKKCACVRCVCVSRRQGPGHGRKVLDPPHKVDIT